MSIEDTNYYISSESESFVICSTSVKTKGRWKRLGNDKDAKLSAILPVGSASSPLNNRNYQDLIDNLHISRLDNRQILQIIKEKYCIDSSATQFKAQVANQDAQLEEWLDPVSRDILRLRLHDKWSIDSICSRFETSRTDVKRLF